MEGLIVFFGVVSVVLLVCLLYLRQEAEFWWQFGVWPGRKKADEAVWEAMASAISALREAEREWQKAEELAREIPGKEFERFALEERALLSLMNKENADRRKKLEEIRKKREGRGVRFEKLTKLACACGFETVVVEAKEEFWK